MNTHDSLSWSQVLGVITDGRDLTRDEASWAMSEIMTDNATSAQIAAFGVGVKMKGAASSELSGMAAGMLAHARRVDLDTRCVDIVGTGGDRSHTVNISTMTSVVVAAAGVPVVKHGNRAASSKSGGADVLEALGVQIALDASQVAACVREVGIGFCFAPVFHPALRFAGAARKEIGIPTVFNVLGPLTNPAQPAAGLVGCAFADLAPVMADTFAERGNSVVLVRGDDGLDELTTTGTSTIWRVRNGRVTREAFDPAQHGLATVDLSALRGGDAQDNAVVARDLLAGAQGPVRDVVVLNAAAAMVAFDDRDGDFGELIDAAMDKAHSVIDDGSAAALLNRWASLTQQLAS